LPPLKAGQVLWSGEPSLQEKHTQPPAHFTDASLLAAMTGIGRFVQDKSLKSILKETDGLGTEATRAGIIELLFKRRFLQREGKSIRATALGKTLINALPEASTRPDMTAHWEKQLQDIAHKALNYAAFMQPMTEQLHQLIHSALTADTVQFSGLAGSAANAAGRRKYSSGKKSVSRAGRAGKSKSTAGRSRKKTPAAGS